MNQQVWSTVVAVVLIAGMNGTAVACNSNFDCNIGSTCVKDKGQGYKGICVGGMQLGQTRQQRSRSFGMDPVQINGQTRGQQCWSNMDCGIGKQCVKTAGSMYGACN